MKTRPDSTMQDREIPSAVAERLQIVLRLNEPPATLDVVADTVSHIFEAAGTSVEFEELCLTGSSRHEARVGDDVHHFRCVLDTLLLPFVLEEPTEFDIRSRSPVSDAVIEMTVGREGISVEPETAVISFGVAADVEPPDSAKEVVSGYGYETFCPYVNAFSSETEYDEWAAETPNAATMMLPVLDAFAFAREFTSE